MPKQEERRDRPQRNPQERPNPPRGPQAPGRENQPKWRENQ